jgi:hypothetical protein
MIFMFCGEMGLSITDLYEMTFGDFHAYRLGWMQQREALSREQWTMTREVMISNLMPWVKNIKKEDVLRFPWEKKIIQKAKQLDDHEFIKEIEGVKDFWANYDKRKGCS